MTNFLQQAIPVADWVESFTDWLTQTFAGLFSFIQSIGQGVMDGVTNFLLFIPALVWIVALTFAAFFLGKKKPGLGLLTFFGLLFIYNQGLWTDLMNTVTLVLLASVLSVVIGIPLGILMAKSDRGNALIAPLLDFMQTMPAFVYLIPAVAFFGIGMVPGVFASVIFALPPTVRMTNLGIRQIPKELVEASDSFGGTGRQKLFKLELPLAKSTIMAGINQTMMLALSMVVTASMIGAPGLGRGVLSALQQAQVGNGFVNGLALVILAIIIDRFTQKLNAPKKAKQKRASLLKSKKGKVATVISGVAVLALIAAATLGAGQSSAKGKVHLAYVEWDTEIASTNVVAEVLRSEGYDVELTPLDMTVMWQSVANGETDGMVAAWLPTTHEAQYQKYKDQLTDLGDNLKGAKLGLVVPSYMDVNSIAELGQEADQTITGIEPGAGVMKAAEATQQAYGNLADWQVASASSGAMTVALDKAIKNEEPIVITGWSPHWMFAKYDLKYLDDPKGTMGGSESIHTMVRKGLKEDLPEAYRILDAFHWEQADMESVMLAITEGKTPQQAAKDWIASHPEEVAAWVG
ncbi:ABC transporter permease/substrate binding protein [Enterococcus asini]|uniref:ABC transporter permease/substrate binding protein n=1 Tax=Enterococcus asini TaxID=57732 RepID=A0AAW8TRV1_9ENTE|nr:ABC transporter permease/substrate binding protein [Enterococcus asini]MDT2809028.1 ABC transporter permease/substrate binding protein [Enterococcus asini]